MEFLRDSNLIFLVLIFAVFYFFMIRPQMKQRKKEKEFTSNLKKGDNVVTKSGMHGKILDVIDRNDTVILETGAGKITFDRTALSLEMTEKRNKPSEEKAK